MANVAKVLKAEIARISRKESRSAVADIGKSQNNLKKIVADLKRRVASLEKDNKRLVSESKKQKPISDQPPPDDTVKARLSSKGIRSLRSRLRLTQADFAKLVGTTTHSVYLWERKEGPLKLRDRTRNALLAIRNLAPKEAQEKLEESETQSKKGKNAAAKS